MLKKKKIAIIHDWLEKKAGAEKVLEEILKVFPKSDVFVIVDFMSSKDRKFLSKKKVIKSFIHYLPFSKNHFIIKNIVSVAWAFFFDFNVVIGLGDLTRIEQRHSKFFFQFWEELKCLKNIR